ncbi:uncharacterized protein TRIVIDRAFT_91995 [Trichoderma virens Gv29-8]|uniref:Uncharacterized protein n=1 Tax=Hypocrea virens (strain Gv29-8 / FGSC 10586) TaxID=413071 RepID=G9MGS6_HYPVG|nr:uncharacterized protein TRIVIDRAFT_91995 [Trichoderma virens Gv29-8]EHK25921.1 hypothetical protein TRIVIDRAFT_91995 [Trichoderma virens Gv29-8]
MDIQGYASSSIHLDSREKTNSYLYETTNNANPTHTPASTTWASPEDQTSKLPVRHGVQDKRCALTSSGLLLN